jgi:7,8-dihydropterin-6-yl-methyl-4-(beta-D-ribofuranosyl)aminobenzene 5'-phosphate synthase
MAKKQLQLVFIGFALLLTAHNVLSADEHMAEAVNVTILSSNLANGATIGKWELSALVEADNHCVLFDAGRYPDTVIHNARALNVDLSCVTDVVLSHFHFDHTTGLMPLVRTLRKQMLPLKGTFEALGVEFIEHAKPAEVVPGVWVTGTMECVYPEKNFPSTIKINIDNKWVEDHVPDSQALTVVTNKGHIVLLGYGHSGVGNALAHIRTKIKRAPIHALMSGLHLYAASDETLGWTADVLREIGVEHLMAGHCTGIEPLIRLRVGLNLNRRTAVVGAVGSRFVYGEGFKPTMIAM